MSHKSEYRQHRSGLMSTWKIESSTNGCEACYKQSSLCSWLQSKGWKCFIRVRAATLGEGLQSCVGGSILARGALQKSRACTVREVNKGAMVAGTIGNYLRVVLHFYSSDFIRTDEVESKIEQCSRPGLGRATKRGHLVSGCLHRARDVCSIELSTPYRPTADVGIGPADCCFDRS